MCVYVVTKSCILLPSERLKSPVGCGLLQLLYFACSKVGVYLVSLCLQVIRLVLLLCMQMMQHTCLAVEVCMLHVVPVSALHCYSMRYVMLYNATAARSCWATGCEKAASEAFQQLWTNSYMVRTAIGAACICSWLAFVYCQCLQHACMCAFVVAGKQGVLQVCRLTSVPVLVAWVCACVGRHRTVCCVKSSVYHIDASAAAMIRLRALSYGHDSCSMYEYTHCRVCCLSSCFLLLNLGHYLVHTVPSSVNMGRQHPATLVLSKCV